MLGAGTRRLHGVSSSPGMSYRSVLSRPSFKELRRRLRFFIFPHPAFMLSVGTVLGLLLVCYGGSL
jgi:uncharacterized membrane protein (DUF485 family)